MLHCACKQSNMLRVQDTFSVHFPFFLFFSLVSCFLVPFSFFFLSSVLGFLFVCLFFFIMEMLLELSYQGCCVY